MSLPATDTFTGVSADPLSANWTTIAGSFEQGGAGTARSSHGSAISSTYWNADTFGAAQYAQAVITVSSTSTAGASVYVSNAGGVNRYTYAGYVGGSYLGKQIAGGSEAVIVDFGAGFVNGDVLKITVGSGVIRAFKNGVQVGTDVSDSSLSSGSAGMMGYLANGSLKLFEGGNVSGTGAALSGTAAGGLTESDVVSGGRTIVLTLTGATYIAS